MKPQQYVITLTLHCSLSLCACLSLLLSRTQTHTSEGRWEASLLAPPPVSRTCAVSDVRGSIVIKSGLAIFIILHSSGQSLTIQMTEYSITSLLPLLFLLPLFLCIFVTTDTIDSHGQFRNWSMIKHSINSLQTNSSSYIQSVFISNVCLHTWIGWGLKHVALL